MNLNNHAQATTARPDIGATIERKRREKHGRIAIAVGDKVANTYVPAQRLMGQFS